MSMFDPNAKTDRQPPPMPDPTGVEYPRAASWASGSCAAVLKDEKGNRLEYLFVFVGNIEFIRRSEIMLGPVVDQH
ncbi:hypothetical protein TELCIR_05692 [Teladorsagia circumcincta]|uniref:Uncharacterized protein n=1 Tax=Teladorsagia circumcincta TaxID=45464 RepID=A0A2G9USB0_TELCI|nr:hypothetical protein TELCIR_05692 [Teladorsagia circumcincta]